MHTLFLQGLFVVPHLQSMPQSTFTIAESRDKGNRLLNHWNFKRTSKMQNRCKSFPLASNSTMADEKNITSQRVNISALYCASVRLKFTWFFNKVQSKRLLQKVKNRATSNLQDVSWYVWNQIKIHAGTKFAPYTKIIWNKKSRQFRNVPAK